MELSHFEAWKVSLVFVAAILGENKRKCLSMVLQKCFGFEGRRAHVKQNFGFPVLRLKIIHSKGVTNEIKNCQIAFV